MHTKMCIHYWFFFLAVAFSILLHSVSLNTVPASKSGKLLSSSSLESVTSSLDFPILSPLFCKGKFIIICATAMLLLSILTGLNTTLCDAGWQVIATTLDRRISLSSHVSWMWGGLWVRVAHSFSGLKQKLCHSQRKSQLNGVMWRYSHCRGCHNLTFLDHINFKMAISQCN